MTNAAAIDYPIEHSSALNGLLAGLAIGAGAVLVGMAVVGTAGLGTVVLGAMVGAGAATGAGFGELIGSLSFACSEAGQIRTGSGDVHINGKPAARAHLDTAECSKHSGAPQKLAQGSDSVYINGQPAARVNDRTVCDGKISAGSPNVMIGGGTKTMDAINPEVPVILERAIMAIELGSAFVLASPVIVVAGLVGGVVGGKAGHWAGGELFRELSSNGANVKTVKRGTNGESKLSPELYKRLRAKSPSREIQDKVNAGIVLPTKDPALPGLMIRTRLHVDHIVPMKQITEMREFEKLSFNQQVELLNYEPNFHGLSATANTSRGAKTFAEWTHYRKKQLEVDVVFRNKMIERASVLELEIQSMMDAIVAGG